MRALSHEEVEALSGLGKGRYTNVYAQIINLPVGAGLVIEVKDWKTKTPPYRVVKNVTKNTGRVFEAGRMPDGSGWFVKRTA